MIEELRIRDFALVDDLHLGFEAGLNAITGETGAGKSILLQALGLLLGDRASRDSVRAGAEQARVEGSFLVGDAVREPVGRILEEAGVAWEPEEPLLVTRVVGSDGRSRAYVNGSGAPSALLTRLGEHLVEFSGQHQHQGLLREETHLALLDTALDEEGRDAKAEYARAYRRWREKEQRLDHLRQAESRGRERADALRFQCDEIKSADLRPGEDEDLRRERDVLAHAGKLQELYGAAETELYSGPEAALDRIGRAARGVETAAARDPEATAVLDLLEEARSSVEEAALVLRARTGALDPDPRRLDQLEERLHLIQRLERKYGGAISEILERLSVMERELWELDNAELALEEAQREFEEARARVEECGARLQRGRERAADELEERVNRELEVLALGSASLRVEWIPGPVSAEGPQGVRFLLAANPGEPAKPLAKVASGGELSRVLLAVKNALRDDRVETLVFDEVDAGIGGVTAEAVGDRLAELAGSCQVVVITHLAQIAPRARHHLRVEKRVVDARTVTEVHPLDRRQRVEELARMLSGKRVTPTTLHHAAELLERYAP